MKQNEILDIITQTLTAVFDLQASAISLSTSTSSVSNWDSLNQIKLIVALEEEFDLEYEPEEISEMTSVKAILEITEQKLAS